MSYQGLEQFIVSPFSTGKGIGGSSEAFVGLGSFFTAFLTGTEILSYEMLLSLLFSSSNERSESSHLFSYKLVLCVSVGIDGDFLYRYHSDNLGCISIDIKIYQNTLKDV